MLTGFSFVAGRHSWLVFLRLRSVNGALKSGVNVGFTRMLIDIQLDSGIRELDHICLENVGSVRCLTINSVWGADTCVGRELSHLDLTSFSLSTCLFTCLIKKHGTCRSELNRNEKSKAERNERERVLSTQL